MRSIYEIGERVKVKTTFQFKGEEHHFEGTGIVVSHEERSKCILREQGCDIDDTVPVPEECFSIKMDQPDEYGQYYFVMHQKCLSKI